ncbi:MAG: hypothetical protein AABW50_05680 [Nanoarchaeota archaeon]
MQSVIVQVDNFEEAKKKLGEARAKSPDRLIGFTGSNDELNRKIIEKLDFGLFMPILFFRKDWQKQRNSGFDNVMAREAKKKSIVIGIHLSEMKTHKGKQKAEILARISQNIKLCSKNKVKMRFIGGENLHDLKALGLVLGMPTWMTKEL